MAHGITQRQYQERVAEDPRLLPGTEVMDYMLEQSEEARSLYGELNGSFHTPEQVRAAVSAITGEELDPSVSIFPPFTTDFGKHLHIGAGTFLNAGVRVQDQGGVFLGERVWKSTVLASVDKFTLRRIMRNTDAIKVIMRLELFRSLDQSIFETVANKSGPSSTMRKGWGRSAQQGGEERAHRRGAGLEVQAHADPKSSSSSPPPSLRSWNSPTTGRTPSRMSLSKLSRSCSNRSPASGEDFYLLVNLGLHFQQPEPSDLRVSPLRGGHFRFLYRHPKPPRAAHGGPL